MLSDNIEQALVEIVVAVIAVVAVSGVLYFLEAVLSAIFGGG